VTAEENSRKVDPPQVTDAMPTASPTAMSPQLRGTQDTKIKYENVPLDDIGPNSSQQNSPQHPPAPPTSIYRRPSSRYDDMSHHTEQEQILEPLASTKTAPLNPDSTPQGPGSDPGSAPGSGPRDPGSAPHDPDYATPSKPTAHQPVPQSDIGKDSSEEAKGSTNT
jgi:hypothetical protein